MKKKVCLLFLLALVVSSSLFASIIQVGPTVAVNVPLHINSKKIVDLKEVDFTKYAVGGDIRFNFGPVQLKTDIKGKFDSDLKLVGFDFMLAFGLRADFKWVELDAGFGLWDIGLKESKTWQFNGKKFTNLGDMFLDSDIYYRLGITFNIYRVSIAIDAFAPINTTLRGLDEIREQSILASLSPNFERTNISIGFLFNFF